MRIDSSLIQEKRAVSNIRTVAAPSTPASKNPEDRTAFSNIVSPGPEHAERLARLRLVVAADEYRASAPEVGQQIVRFYLVA